MKTTKKIIAGVIGAASLALAATASYAGVGLYPDCNEATVGEIGSGYIPVTATGAQIIYPAYRWVELTCSSPGINGGGVYGNMNTNQKLVYLLHPGWDQDGKLAALLTAKVEGKNVRFTTLMNNTSTPDNAAVKGRWLLSVSILSPTPAL
ncbi:hypothetical protein VU07_01610 [Desulfobulbus sp. F4]|nr:hypothetical protein [Desulfobulbus sp. F3]MCW5200502.1 hypothetical protein [Desulfobulbus sp. F4]